MHGHLDRETVIALAERIAAGVAAVRARPPAGLTDVERTAWGMHAARAWAALEAAVRATGAPSATDAARVYWLLPLALAIRDAWRTRGADAGALRRLAEEQGETPTEAKGALVAAAILLAHAEAAEPGRVRLGAHWVADGAPVLAGARLSIRDYLRHFVARTIRLARRSLRDATPEAAATVPVDLPDPTPDPLAILEAGEPPDLAPILALATTGQRAQLVALLRAWRDNPGLSLAAAGRAANLSTDQTKKLVSRLRAKVAPSAPRPGL